ncbi:KAT8 regulatory NSL complex subunit 1 isoform X2 [Anthonomus grandis grandis]|uniref:KAT8 regulatory NSL complex subunit 1 isoform X2 n=1 Tax=Anthonomus grandis grandis TaxID=2921223 RepID=UPI0021654757|nr:KAT8 regulatory NSL complex subunit 1 isoform X2 [Anthonomus grandis grandis]
MGLRTASVRCPESDVMAPALTDAVQASKNFNLPSISGHLEPASPINTFDVNKFSPTAVKKPTCEPPSPLNTDDLSISYDYLAKFNGGSQLNMSSSPMGDRDDTMGLQKNELLGTSLNKSKSSGEEDNLLEANVEDIMQQVIKSIGSTDQLNNSSSDLTDLDLNIDKDLLDHVDNMMNISIDEQSDDLDTAQKIKENQAAALLSDLESRHSRIERRLDFLRRRCFKLQSKHIGQHISGEVVGVFEQVHRSIKKPKDQDNSKSFGLNQYCDLTDKLKPLSASSAKVLARKLEMAKVLQANNSARQKNIPKYFGSGSIEPAMFRSSSGGQVTIPHWSAEHKQELKRVSDQLQVQLRVVQHEVDSEATESSSGGESCDESQTYNNPHQQYLSIQKRALWKYSTDRAAIASRWTWIQSQISDLEYRIRQHTELHKKIRAAKGAVKLGEVIVRSPPVQSESEIAGHHDYGVSPISTDASTAINGYVGQLPGASSPQKHPEPDDCQYCARTRPLTGFRKRRLLQIAGLHAVSKKAARPSTVRCNCVIPNAPCALCTGRVDPTHPRDSPETLGKSEKVALLDPAYHPVLSLFEDTSQALHLEAIMKMPEWQQRSLKMKTTKVLHKTEKEMGSYEHASKKLEHRKKYNRLKSVLSEKIKKKLRGRKAGRPIKLSKRQSLASLSQHLQNLEATGSEDAEVEQTLEGGSQLLDGGGRGGTSSVSQHTRSAPFDSPGGSPLLHMQSISGYKQNNRASRIGSYDIDNIVIPYSVAASTRVEKLQYKEILTPKWRMAGDGSVPTKSEKNNGSVGEVAEDSDFEDISEEAVTGRHDRAELDEKKRFLSYMKLPPGYGRQRSHKRHDSLAESSGANTPDPASPHHHTDGGGAAGGGKVGSDGLMAAPLGSPPSSSSLAEYAEAMARRRTVSQSRYREILKDDGPPVDYVEKAPFEPRNFPLSESDFEHMIQDMPDPHRGEVRTNYRAQDTGDDLPNKSEIVDSADSESTESAIGEDAIMMEDEDERFLEEEDDDEEDPNDPEWTDAEKSGHRDRHHRR